MGSPMFDTLSYSKRLREAGVPEAQAEAHATLLIEAVQENLATKQDVAELKRDIAEVHGRIDGLKTELKRDIADVRTELKRDLVVLENRMTIKLGWMLTAAVAAMATLTKLL